MATNEITNEKCFCHLGEYKVKDADARKDITDLKENLRQYKLSVSESLAKANKRINEIDGGFSVINTTMRIDNNVVYFEWMEAIDGWYKPIKIEIKYLQNDTVVNVIYYARFERNWNENGGYMIQFYNQNGYFIHVDDTIISGYMFSNNQELINEYGGSFISIHLDDIDENTEFISCKITCKLVKENDVDIPFFMEF